MQGVVGLVIGELALVLFPVNVVADVASGLDASGNHRLGDVHVPFVISRPSKDASK